MKLIDTADKWLGDEMDKHPLTRTVMNFAPFVLAVVAPIVGVVVWDLTLYQAFGVASITLGVSGISGVIWSAKLRQQNDEARTQFMEFGALVRKQNMETLEDLQRLRRETFEDSTKTQAELMRIFDEAINLAVEDERKRNQAINQTIEDERNKHKRGGGRHKYPPMPKGYIWEEHLLPTIVKAYHKREEMKSNQQHGWENWVVNECEWPGRMSVTANQVRNWFDRYPTEMYEYEHQGTTQKPSP